MEKSSVKEQEIVSKNNGPVVMVQPKVLSANWFRKLGLIVGGTVFALGFSWAIFALTTNTATANANYPAWVNFLVLGALALLCYAAAGYGVVSLLMTKLTLDMSGIRLKTPFKNLEIPMNKILSVNKYTETVDGFDLFMTLQRYTIITKERSYEVSDHDFWGLEEAMEEWISLIPDNEDENSRVDGISWQKNIMSKVEGFLYKEDNVITFVKYRKKFDGGETRQTKSEIILNRIVDSAVSVAFPEKEVFKLNKNEIRNVEYTNTQPVHINGARIYSASVKFEAAGQKYTLDFADTKNEELDKFNEFFKM